MCKESPYEYHKEKLSVQGRFLFSGKNAHPDSLELITEVGFKQKIRRNNIVKLRTACLNTPMLVSFESLPHKWQELIVTAFGEAQKLTKQTLFEKHYIRDMKAFDFFSLHKFDDQVGLGRENIDKYTANASVLNTIGKVYEKRSNLRKEMRGSIFGIGKVLSVWETIAIETRRMKEFTGHTLPEDERRLREKYNGYKKEGYSFLIHKGHRQTNALKVDDDHIELLNNMFTGLDHKPTYAEVSRIYEGFLNGYVEVINKTTGELYNSKSFEKLSVATVWNHLSKWENKSGNFLSRDGNRQNWMQLFKPYHNLNKLEKAGAIVSIDDRQPPFVYNKAGDRVWFYCGADVGSEAFVSWIYGTSKEGIIAEFYRQMVRNYAMWGLRLPYELECESALNSAYKNTLLQEGNMFERVRIEANNARGKVIERYWLQLRYGKEKEDIGWLARPFALSEANQSRTDRNTKIIVPYDEIVNRSLHHIQEWNNMEHSKIKGMSRWDVFLSMQHPGLTPVNYHGILPYIGFTEKSSVHAGMINFRSEKFLLGMDGVICVGDKLINMMKQVEGRDIEIKWLDNNHGEVLKAYIYLDNRFICEAVQQPGYRRAKIDQDEHDLMNRELMSKYVTTIESFANRHKKGLDKLTIIDNRPVTIGNSFKIFDPNGHIEIEYIPNPEPAKGLASIDNDPEPSIISTQTTSFVKPLLNRF
jgi:hypothetical protein